MPTLTITSHLNTYGLDLQLIDESYWKLPIGVRNPNRPKAFQEMVRDTIHELQTMSEGLNKIALLTWKQRKKLAKKNKVQISVLTCASGKTHEQDQVLHERQVRFRDCAVITEGIHISLSYGLRWHKLQDQMNFLTTGLRMSALVASRARSLAAGILVPISELHEKGKRIEDQVLRDLEEGTSLVSRKPEELSPARILDLAWSLNRKLHAFAQNTKEEHQAEKIIHLVTQVTNSAISILSITDIALRVGSPKTKEKTRHSLAMTQIRHKTNA